MQIGFHSCPNCKKNYYFGTLQGLIDTAKKDYRICSSCGSAYKIELGNIAGEYFIESVKLVNRGSQSSSEVIVRELESSWQVVKHGRDYEWSKSMFQFGLLRKPVLTNKRLILYNKEQIDFQIPIERIRSVEADTIASGNSLLRVELKDGGAFSLFFTCVGAKMFFGAPYMYGKANSIVNQWVQSINNLLLKLNRDHS